MPSLWVVKREMRRVLDQAKFPFLLATAPVMRLMHDRSKLRSSRITPGTRLRGAKVALFLLYQPKGLLPSTIETCRHLAAKGFSCLIVSNAALSDQDRAALAPYCFTMLERPNFGYDFGGYRDGIILHLLDTAEPMDRLLVLNDSVWFPTVAHEDFLDRVSTQTADLYGAVLAQRKRRDGGDHVQTYAFAFSQKVMQSEAFANYWSSLPICNNRRWTIRQCECKMTSYFRDSGFSVGARWDFNEVIAAVGRLSDDNLVGLLQLDAKLKLNRTSSIEALIARQGQSGWRVEVEAYVRSPDFRKLILSLHPAALAEMNFPFLKKSFDRHYATHRPIYARVLRESCDPIMLTEIAKWDR